MGLNPSEDEFWLILDTEHGKFDLRMTPWNNAMSSMKVAQAVDWEWAMVFPDFMAHLLRND